MARRKETQQRLERTVALIQRKWGQEALRQGVTPARTIPHIPTGFAELDAATGIGGVPRGRITVLSGAATSGKITLAALVLARSQGKGRLAAYVDLLHTCDADYLERCGVRLRDLLVVRPEHASQALELTQTLVARSEVAAILFDHWGAVEADGRARSFIAGMLDQLVGLLAHSQAALLIVDDPPSPWQRLLPVIGGPLAHYAALHLVMSREQWFLAGPDVRGYRARVTLAKNKLGPAGQTVPIEIHFNGTVRGRGI
jgi:recombination protein RecA